VTDGPTPHLEGTRGDYAPTVLLPGDPKRARFIADTYLDDARQVNAVRGADGFTGSYNGTPVSVQSVGMGIPSAAIYYTELIRFYGCERLIRVGSCGGLSEAITLGDVIVATAAGTDSATVATLNGGLTLPAVADWGMLRGAVEAAEAADIAVSVGPVFTSDMFYGPDAEKIFPILQGRGILGVEMEIAGLYAVAAAEGAKAVALLTVSDDIVRGTVLTSQQREDTFDNMVRVALAVA
jgi:purine-nucleoside phosphorylase